MDIAYGIEVRSNEDSYLQAADEGAICLGIALTPGAFLVDTFPILKYIPAWVSGAGFQTRAKGWKAVTDHIFNAPFEALKKAVVCFRILCAAW